jgi:hypothetical protein
MILIIKLKIYEVSFNIISHLKKNKNFLITNDLIKIF